MAGEPRGDWRRLLCSCSGAEVSNEDSVVSSLDFVFSVVLSVSFVPLISSHVLAFSVSVVVFSCLFSVSSSSPASTFSP